MKELRILLPALILCFLVWPADAARRKGDNPRIKALEKIARQAQETLDSLVAQRWQNKYEETEKRKSLLEEQRNLDQDYSRLMTERNAAEEKALRLRRETDDRKDALEIQRERYQGLRRLGLEKLESHKDAPSSRNPAGLNERIRKMNRLQARQEKEDILKATNDLLEFRLQQIRLSQSQELKTVKSTDDSGRVEEALQLRIGQIHYSEIGKASANARMLFPTGRLRGQLFVWRSDLDANSQKTLRRALLPSKGNPLPTSGYLPTNVLQSRAMLKVLKADGSGVVWSTVWNFLKQGGPVMVPLGLIALLAIFMIGERSLIYRRKKGNTRKLMRKIDPLLAEGKIEELTRVCTRADKTSLGRTLAAILEKSAQKRKRDQAEHAFQEAVLNEMPPLEKRLSTIAVLGSTAPLLGLLGTVAGMISLFEVITNYGTSDPKLLAGGISEALITTETGLIVAIPIILLHNYLANKMNDIVGEIHQHGLALLNRLWPDE